MIKTILPYFQIVRLHHWSKNLLIFIPLFASHKFTEISLLKTAGLLFLAQGLLVSSTYIINDIFDYEADKVHPTKKNRPIASHKLSKLKAGVLSMILGVSAFFIGSQLSQGVMLFLCAYALSSFLYSYYLKKVIIIDIVVLAFFYIYRILLGHYGLSINHSMWLLTFCFFFFLGLAISKRVIELLQLAKSKKKETESRRGYEKADLTILIPLGLISSLLSVLTYCLYINSSDMELLYNAPYYLWVNSILLLVFITRYWIFVGRETTHSDPVVFLLKEPTSYIIGVLIFVFGMMAKWA